MDRNKYVVQCRKVMNVSLSARRAWIEIVPFDVIRPAIESLSARRAWIEIPRDVDGAYLVESLSARRAWIEIIIHHAKKKSTRQVALRKESVDRNLMFPINVMSASASLSARRAWIEIKIITRLLPCSLGRSPQGERG